MLKGLKINKKNTEDQTEKVPGPLPQKKWKKNKEDDDDKELSLPNNQIPPPSVQILHDTSKYDAEFQKDLLKSVIKEKHKQFGEEEDEASKFKGNSRLNQKIQQKHEQQEKNREIRQDKRNQKILENCQYCLQNQMLGENYIISNGFFTMLLLSQTKQYKNYWHLQIIPIDHVESVRELEDDAWEEMRNYMKCLVAAFDSINMEVVFYENAYNFRQFPHCVLECVAIPYPLLKDAKLDVYFRQGMEDLDGYWSTHKKIIPLGKGEIRKKIPKGFPYFYVDFATQYGLAHVIEEEKYFSKTFAGEILATVMKIDKSTVISSPQLSNDEAKALKEKFMKFWEKFDWTDVIKQK